MLTVFDDGFDVRLCSEEHGARERFVSSPLCWQAFLKFFSRHAKGVFLECGGILGVEM